jgi:hypothetical protein
MKTARKFEVRFEGSTISVYELLLIHVLGNLDDVILSVLPHL